MRAGRLNHRVTFRERDGTTWPILKTVWGQISPPDRSLNVDQTELRSPYVVAVRLRYDADIKSGQLMVFGTRWFFVEAVAEINTRRAEMVLSCREFIGFDATYTPLAGGSFTCIAFPVEQNVWVGVDTTLNQQRYFVDVLIPQVGASYAQHKDVVQFNDLDYSVISSVSGGDDNVVVRLLCEKPTPATVIEYVISSQGFVISSQGFVVGAN